MKALFTLGLFMIAMDAQQPAGGDSLSVQIQGTYKMHKEPVGLFYALEESTYVKVELLNILNKSLGIVFEGIQPKGEYQIDKLSFEVSDGIYLFEVIIGNKQFRRKAVILNNEFPRMPAGPPAYFESGSKITTKKD